VAAARRYPLLILAGAALMTLLGLGWGLLTAPPHTASAQLVLADPLGIDPAYPDRPVGGDAERFLGSQAKFVGTDTVIDAAAEQLNMNESTLAAAVSARASSDGGTLIVSATGSSAGRAEDRLNSVLAAYSTARRDLLENYRAELSDAVEAARGDEDASSAELRQRLADLESGLVTYDDGVSFVQSTERSGGNAMFSAISKGLVAGFLGLSIGLVAAWLLADRNPRIEQAEGLVSRHRIPLIGRIPRRRGDAGVGDAASEVVLLGLEHRLGLVESYQDPDVRSRQIIIFAGVEAEAGTTTTLQDTALAAADSGLKVLIVDATTHLGQAGSELERAPIAAAQIETLAQTAAGGRAMRWAPDASQGGTFVALRLRPDFDSYLDELRNEYDFILIDCPALSVDSTALKLTAHSDGIVLVVRQGTDAGAADNAISLLDNVGMPIIGYVYTFETGRLLRGPGKATTPMASWPLGEGVGVRRA